MEWYGQWYSDMYNRVLSSPINNLAVGFTSRRTRSHLISDEYNTALYHTARNRDASKDASSSSSSSSTGGKDPLMRELVITPKGWDKVDSEAKKLPFSPHKHNWRRSTKVPAIFINCTTLNTGHLWRFTPTYMVTCNHLPDTLPIVGVACMR